MTYTLTVSMQSPYAVVTMIIQLQAVTNVSIGTRTKRSRPLTDPLQVYRIKQVHSGAHLTVCAAYARSLALGMQVMLHSQAGISTITCVV